MASQVKTPTSRPSSRQPAKNHQAARIKKFVDDQLKKTREQVKTVDMLHGILVMIAFVIGCFLVATLIDSWVWPLSKFARWLVLGLIVFGSIGYFFLSVFPLIFKKINPDYAAKMIEDAKPGFKNSIINYVSFRKKPAELKPAIFDAVSRQAATDLSAVPGDATVDRSKLIHIGIVLCALTMFTVAYTVFSPIDPLQSFARILSPAGNHAAPAVVKISDVDPGDTTVFFGETLVISATVKGSHSPDDVLLTYSTLDGQLVDQTVSMLPDDLPNRYKVDLSMTGGGIRQSLTYQITARDGASPDYEIIVQANPSIAIESLLLSPPKYTELRERSLSGQGDVEAIEGTWVTLHANANLPIKTANIELLNEIGDRKFRPAATSIEMQSEGQSCVGRFQVLLNSNRDRPLATHYRINFVSTENDRNENANVYPIRVIPDLAPEIRIRNPVQTDIEIPENGSLVIDVDANDLDFRIKTIRLVMDHQGDQVLGKELQKKSSDGNQRVSSRYVVRPEQLGLKSGDKAIFYATAADNRISPYSDQPHPNVSQTENYTLTVLDADPEQEDKPNEEETKEDPNQKDPEQKQDGDEKEKGESGSEEGDAGNSGEKDGGEDGSKGTEGSEGAQESGAEDSQDQQGSEGSQKNQPSEGSKDSGEGSDDTSKGDPSQSGNDSGQQDDSEGDSSKEKGDQSDGAQEEQNSEQGGDPSDGSNSEGSEGDSQGQQDGGANGDMSDQQKAGDQSKQDGGQSGSDEGLEQGDSDSGIEGSGAKGDGTRDNSVKRGDQERLPDNASEGEQFKKLQEELEAKDERESSSSGNGDQDNPEQESGDREQKQGNEGSADGNQAGSDSNPDGEKKNPKDSSNPEANSENQNGAETDHDQSSKGQNGNSDAKQPKGGEQKENNDSSGNAKDQKKDSGQKGSPKNGMNKDGAKNQNSSDETQDPKGNQPESKGSDSKQSNPKEGNQQVNEGDQQGSQSGGSKDAEGLEEEGSGQKSGKPSDSGSKSDSQSDSSSSESGEGGSAAKPNNKAAKGQSQTPADGGQGQESSQSDSGGESNSSSSESPSSSATGSGAPSGGGGGQALVKDELNQDHARKATDMVLKRLAEERHDPDPDLLDKMNWDKDDLNNFLDRWNAMKEAAGKGDPNARRKYEKALKSLGMKPKATRRQVGQSDESVGDLNQDGAVNRPPAEFELDFNAFQRDLNRGDR